MAGHTRPLCTLASRIATFESEPVIITVYTTVRVYDAVLKEVARGFLPDEGDLKARVRFVSFSVLHRVFDSPLDRVIALDLPPDVLADLGLFDKFFAVAYQSMVECQPVTCAKTKLSVEMPRSPDVAIFDVSNLVD